ncbi:hypothetical protein ACMFMF_000516 [Clarireedia jacksonii]
MTTPLLNQSKDLIDYLHQLYRPEWDLHDEPFDLTAMFQPDFDPRTYSDPPPKDDICHPRRKNVEHEEEGSRIRNLMPERNSETEVLWDAVEKGIKLYLLNPQIYKRCGQANGWRATTTKVIMPPILQIILLRMGYETEIDLEDGSKLVSLGATIPRCDVYAVQLGMNAKEARVYDNVALSMLSSLGVGPQETTRASAVTAGARIMHGFDEQRRTYAKYCCSSVSQAFVATPFTPKMHTSKVHSGVFKGL